MLHMRLRHLSARRQLRCHARSLRPQLYRLAWSWCHDSQLADDLVQEALARGLERIDQLREPEHLKIWLCRILSNLHCDRLRARKDCVDCDEAALCSVDDPVEAAEQEELIATVRGAIGQLSEDHRKVLTLVELMECSYAQVATILDIPIGTVMSRLYRARERLKQQLEHPPASRPARPTLRSVK